MNEEKVEILHRQILDWSEGNLREFPWREDVSRYEVLIAEILLSATLASKVKPVYEEITTDHPDFESLAEADKDELADVLEPLGLHNRRAQALVNLGERLQGDDIPSEVDALRELPWVDYYVSNALLCFGFGKARPIVDVNVIRIYNRFFGTDFDDSEDESAWEFADDVLPEGDVEKFNLTLLDFGSIICTADNPNCQECPLTSMCDYYTGGLD